jgi:hypothetical protein
MADLYDLDNWLKHPPIILPPGSDKWRSLPAGFLSRLLMVKWSRPAGGSAPLTGQIETIVSTPLGDLAPQLTDFSIDTNPKQYQLLRVPAAGFDYQLRYRTASSKGSSNLAIWEFIPDIPSIPMAPAYNPPPSNFGFSGVETRLDSLITATGQNAAAISQLPSQIAAPETSMDSKTYRFKLIPWTGNPDDHKLLDRGLRRFIKMTAETAMTNGDRILIATGRDGRDNLPGPEGWQHNYAMQLGGYYDSTEEDAGQELFAWLPQGNPTIPIEITLTEGL